MNRIFGIISLWYVKEHAFNTKQKEFMELTDTFRDKRCVQSVIFSYGGMVSTVHVVTLC